MERRTFLAIASATLLAAPLAAEAQPTGKVAFLCPGNCSTLPNAVMDWDRAFLAGFERAGYVFGRNASLDMSGAGVGYGRLSDAAKKLVQRKVDVIVAFGNEATQAARQATKSTPIGMVKRRRRRGRGTGRQPRSTGRKRDRLERPPRAARRQTPRASQGDQSAARTGGRALEPDDRATSGAVRGS